MTGLPHKLLVIMFIASYFIMGLSRYVPIPSIGMLADALLIITLIAAATQSGKDKVDWGNGDKTYLYACLIWLIYCTLEIINPYAVASAWFTYVRFVAFYAFFIALLVPAVFSRFKDLKKVIFLWSIFTLLAFLKAFMQKTSGFDTAEMRWLYAGGGASTHILGSGIRYFSFYTDAANFGSGMGMAMVVFIIIGAHTKQIKHKIYYILVGLAAGYGMMLSGTRSAMIIPFAGFAFYVLFSKNVKVVSIGSVFIIAAFVFFSMTNIGQGNAQIRRMRSAFNSEHDASYNLRKANQAKIKAYLEDKPFGVGIGLGGGKAAKSAPGLYSTQIATDSWMVVLRVETGIVGLTLYLAIFIYLQLRGAYIVFFKIKDKQLRYILGAFLSGIFGIMISSYSNEVIAQFPNGIIIFFGQAFVFMGEKLDKELSEQKELKKEEIVVS